MSEIGVVTLGLRTSKRIIGLVRFVPISRASQTFFQRCMREESKVVIRAGHVQAPTGLSIRLIGLPSNLTLEACQASDQVYQVRDLDFRPISRMDNPVGA